MPQVWLIAVVVLSCYSAYWGAYYFTPYASDVFFMSAVAAGATIAYELENKDYGDRGYGALDLEGHLWWFAQRIDQDAWDASIAEHSVPKGGAR